MISKLQAKAILDTLPIGYYIKRNIPVEFDDLSSSSYCDIINEKIVISYPSIKPLLDIIDDSNKEKAEETVRNILYHEVSHAFLTPKKLEANDITNIFEDERIETLLKDYYYGVNFKKFVMEMNDYHGEKPTTPMEEFYQTVRYRVGKKKFVNRVKSIIKEYSDLTYLTKDFFVLRGYQSKIRELYDDISREFGKEVPEDRKYTFEQSMSIISTLAKNDETSKDKSSPIDFPVLTSTIFDKYYDKDLDQKLQLILSNMKSFEKRNGSAINSYSGIFDTRSVLRDDYKYFVQKNRLGNINAFSKIHLNLFIDVSGSFFASETKVNQLLYSLTKYEKIEPKFSFDLVTMQIGETLQPKNKRQISCDGGNYLDEKIFSIYNKLQLKDAQNFNIVLFDGDALTDIPGTMKYKKFDIAKNFKAFNYKNTTIISDCSNKLYIDGNCDNAKVIFTIEYADELIVHVLNTLSIFAR